MNKLAFFLSLLLIPLVLAAAFVWFFSVHLDPQIPQSAKIESLENEVDIDWHSTGTTISFRTSDLDAYRALGFTHATRHPWMLALLRQVAIGEIGTWFESDLATIDSVVQVLDIGRLSRAAAATLSPRTEAVLNAYSEGVTGAFKAGKIYRDESFLSIGNSPDDWEPWHSLAIEKLLAWIAAAEGIADYQHSAESGLLAGSFQISSFLRTGGFSNSIAWSVQNPDSTVFGVRYNTGASTLPILVPTRFVGDNGRSHQTLTILGTPFDVFYKDESDGYTVLPAGGAEYRTIRTDSSSMLKSFGRIRHFDGREDLVTRTTIGDDHVLRCETRVAAGPEENNPPLEPSRQLYCDVVSWPGFEAVTDANLWTRDQTSGSFRLWNMGRSRFSHSGTTTLDDTIWMASAYGNRVAVGGNSKWTPFLRTRLLSLTSDPTWRATGISSDQKSSWAEAATTLLVSSLMTHDTTETEVATALTYLRNWDHSYGRSSIAASILEQWSEFVTVDSLMAIVETDPTLGQMANMSFSAARTLDSLEARFGSDMSEWRWETVNSQVLKTPAWSYVDESKTEYAPYARVISRHGPVPALPAGHPSAISWNASAASGSTPYPAAIYVSVNSNDFNNVVYEFQDSRSMVSPSVSVSGPAAATKTKIDLASAEVIDRTELRP